MLYFRTCSFLTSTSISTRTPLFSEILVSFLTLTSLFQHQRLFGYIHLSFHIYNALSIHLPFFTSTKKRKRSLNTCIVQFMYIVFSTYACAADILSACSFPALIFRMASGSFIFSWNCGLAIITAANQSQKSAMWWLRLVGCLK